MLGASLVVFVNRSAMIAHQIELQSEKAYPSQATIKPSAIKGTNKNPGFTEEDRGVIKRHTPKTHRQGMREEVSSKDTPQRRTAKGCVKKCHQKIREVAAWGPVS